MNLTIGMMLVLIAVIFLYVLLICMETKNAFGIPMRMAKHVVPPTRKADQTGLYDIRLTALPHYFQRKLEYTLEDGAPAGKWVGRFESDQERIHFVTVLCYQVNQGDLPTWVVRTSYNHADRLYTMEMHLTTGPLTPDAFSDLYPQLEAEIIKQEQLWDPKGF